MKKEDIKAYIENLVRPILSSQSALKVDIDEDERAVNYSIFIDKRDFGRVIGRNGNTISAIRSIVRIVGLTHGISTNIRVPDEQ